MLVNVRKRGSALISALFIMTLVAIAATAMSTRLQLDIYRTQLTIASDQLYLASEAVTFWAMDILSLEKNKFTTINKEDKLANFPVHLQSIYPGVTLSGGLYDMQASFNLNNLQDRKLQPIFLRLLEQTLKNSDNSQRIALLNNIFYWITPYQPGRGHDEYIDGYLKQSPPYLPGYQPMQSISELRLIQGVNDKIYQTLLPTMTVLPELTPININTAPKSILMSLGNGLSETQVEDLLQSRGKKGFTDLKDIEQLLLKLDIPNTQITLQSAYYLGISIATTQDINLTTYTVFKRTKDPKGAITVDIVRQSLNTQ